MLTKEPTEARQLTAKPRWPRLAVALATTLVVIGAGVVAWVIVDDGGPVAAGDARIEVTFTGDSTSYIGHREIVQGTATLTLINEWDEPAWFVVQRFDTGSAELDRNLALAPEGGDFVTSEGPPGAVRMTEVLPAASGASPATPSLNLQPGTYLIDAGHAEGEDATHVYRAAVIEVVAD